MKLANISLALLVCTSSVAAVIFALSLRVNDPTAFNIVGAAFCGAAFSFIFVRVGQILDRMDRLQSRHYNALVKAQHYLNLLLLRISDNIYLADEFLKTVAVNRIGNELRVQASANQLEALPVEPDLALEFSNVDVVNDFFELQSEVGRLNHSMLTLEQHYAKIMSTVDSSPDPETLQSNLGRVKENMASLRGFLKEAETQTLRLFATVRVHAKSKPIALRVFGVIHRSTKQGRDLEAKVVEEQRLVEREIEASMSRSQEVIERVESEVQPLG